MIFDIVSLRSLSFQVNNSEIFFILNTLVKQSSSFEKILSATKYSKLR